MDRLQEIEIIVCQACEAIYRYALGAQLDDTEHTYYVSEIINNLSMGLTKSYYKQMRDNNKSEGGAE